MYALPNFLWAQHLSSEHSNLSIAISKKEVCCLFMFLLQILSKCFWNIVWHSCIQRKEEKRNMGKILYALGDTECHRCRTLYCQVQPATKLNCSFVLQWGYRAVCMYIDIYFYYFTKNRTEANKWRKAFVTGKHANKSHI